MTADNNSTEDKPDPTPFQSLPNDERSAQKARAGRAHQGICLQGAGYQICRSPSRRILRGLSARQENLALATRLLMSCIQKRRKPARCQRMRVSGRMIVMAFRTDGNHRY